jgi:hypothetical protein
MGGNAPPATADTELWNGTNWTEVNNLNTARVNYGAGAGTSNSSFRILVVVPGPTGSYRIIGTELTGQKLTI